MYISITRAYKNLGDCYSGRGRILSVDTGVAMSLKPIETIYNGNRFRSRLEARWAVYFDAIGLRYEYEKEGFDLDGHWYLPDFWLPKKDCWVEVKGGES